MKIKPFKCLGVVLVSAILFLGVTTSAHAKITVEGEPLRAPHVDVLKGFLYFVLDRDPKDKNERYMQKGLEFARAINWLILAHYEDEIHELTNPSHQQSRTVLSAFAYLNKVAQGEVPNYDSDLSFPIWEALGHGIEAKILETKANIKWKIFAKKKNPKRLVTGKISKQKKTHRKKSKP
jgi:hypothetical protein